MLGRKVGAAVVVVVVRSLDCWGSVVGAVGVVVCLGVGEAGSSEVERGWEVFLEKKEEVGGGRVGRSRSNGRKTSRWSLGRCLKSGDPTMRKWVVGGAAVANFLTDTDRETVREMEEVLNVSISDDRIRV